jgi:hypothetical protein
VVGILVLLLIAAGVAGYVLQSRSVALPIVTIPCYYGGLREGWWGSGVGDSWEAIMLVMTALGVAVSLLGWLTHSVAHSRQHR